MRLLKAILFPLAIASLLPAQLPLTSEEQRGRQIYERGATSSGHPMTASLGTENSGIPGSILPCANCHGHAGEGKPESGIIPSNITWDALTKPYGVTHPGGRTHPRYTERLLKRAITLGIDPGGNSLDRAMPRFQLSNEDFSDLVTYVKRLGQSVDPGLTATTIRLGVILAPTGRFSNLNRVMRDTLLRYFVRMNAMGGIFGRRVELSFTELPQDPREAHKALGDFTSNEQIFAFVAGFLTGSEPEIASLLREMGTPSVAAFAASPQTGLPFNPYAFYLDGGCPAEVNALADFAIREFPDRSLRVAIAADAVSRQFAPSLRERLRQAGFNQVAESPAEAEVILSLLPESPLPSESTNTAARILVASPSCVPSVSDDSRVWQSRTVAAAEIISEGLKRAGRSVSREALVAALEGLYRFETSAGPVSFGPNRRIGATGVDVKFVRR